MCLTILRNYFMGSLRFLLPILKDVHLHLLKGLKLDTAGLGQAQNVVVSAEQRTTEDL
jgi:hypothetical protein